MEKKKKIFPKLQKKIKGFLTDESGKITKKDALGLTLGSMLLLGLESANAANTHYNHVSGGTTSNYDIGYSNGACSVSHASGIVNGHFSSTPTSTLDGGGITNITGHSSHSSHSNHSSSGSGGCW